MSCAEPKPVIASLVAFAAVIATFMGGPALAQSINTYAGGGPVGDGKPATEATLSSPFYVVIAPDGDLYISEAYGNLVRRVNGQSEIISTVAGGGNNGSIDGVTGPETQILFPQGLALDDAGNLYIADNGHRRIRRIDAGTGIVSTVGGGGESFDDGIPATDAAMPSIRGLSFDTGGNLVFADQGTHRVRRIDRETGLVATLAGNGTRGFSGDGGPATDAQLDRPRDITFDAEGNLYIVGRGDPFVRRVDATSGEIDTINLQDGAWGIAEKDRVLYVSVGLSRVVTLDLETMTEAAFAGTGDRTFAGDGGPAMEAAFNANISLDLDSEGTLYIADGGNGRIRKVVRATGIVDTAAGGGSVGDGGPATSANIATPSSVDITSTGELLIGTFYDSRLRLVDPITRTISTIAGDGIGGESGDGNPAVNARLASVLAVASDSQGNIYIGSQTRVRRIDAGTGIIDTVVGNGEDADAGDGGPATEASISEPYGLAVDGAGNLYLTDSAYHVIRRVDGESGIITRVAGTGEAGFSGDDGTAIEAQLWSPRGIAFDRSDNLYVADQGNHRVRRIDLQTGMITTVAGNGESTESGDDGPAIEAGVRRPRDLAFDAAGNLYIATDSTFSSRIRKVDVESGIITKVAGIDSGGDYRGDGGAATEASLSTAIGVAVDDAGNTFVAELTSGRVRVVFACTGVDAPGLTSPKDNATGLSTAPTLSWSPAPGAFFYDVVIGTRDSPSTVIATDLTTTSFTPSNLEPGVTYRWKVVAKGDPFCPSGRTAESAVWSFSTGTACLTPAEPVLLGPIDGFASADTTIALTWTPSPGASRYDVHVGTTNPPPLVRTTDTASLQVSGLIEGNTYYWAVVAHSACDATRTSISDVRSFSVGGACAAAGPFGLVEPSDGAIDVQTTVTLKWSASSGASNYDLFLGTTNPPPVFLPDMTRTSLRISGLTSNQTYYWRVRADVECDASNGLTTDIASFTTIDDCRVPERAVVTFVPPGDVGAGQTYAITWREARGLDAGGTYLVERSLDPSFSTILDGQEVSTSAATFLASAVGTHYHRIYPLMSCNTGVRGPASETVAVDVVAERPGVIFTVEPKAVFATPGRALEDLRTTFTIENIASSPVSIVVAQALIDSVPFFTIRDPLGGDAVFVELAPREPKTFEVRFSGPPNNAEEAYQGLIALSVANSPVIPYAFVNLKVGDRGLATPEFRVGGVPAEYAFFPGFDGDDAERPPVTVEIHNPGTTPMELGAEIGPEVWLEPDPSWNETPIPAGGTREVLLFTKRTRALNGSALPRYTWFGVRTKTGGAARMLVQDNDGASLSNGRTAALSPDEDSLVIPEVVSETSMSGTVLVSQVRLTNLGSDQVQTELVFTPSGADGFGESVQRATVVVPPNDVATLTDPLVQMFGLTRPSAGQIEVRAAESKIGLLKVETSVVSGSRADASLVQVPTIRRGGGARLGFAHEIAGLTATASSSTNLILVETSGVDQALVTVTLYGADGTQFGQSSVNVPRYGHVRLNDIVSALSGVTPMTGGRLTIEVADGGGSVVSLAKIESHATGLASILQSFPVDSSVNAKLVLGSIARRAPSNGVSPSLVAPYVVSGAVVPGSSVDYGTLVGFVAPFAVPLDFLVTLTGASSEPLQKTVSVLGGSVVEYRNIVRELFGLDGVIRGSIVIEYDPRGRVYARLVAGDSPAGALDLAAPVSELVTMVDSARPLYADGLEQSTDPTRGARWNLYIREVAGERGNISVRLYEAGNRSRPIAVKRMAIEADELVSLETVFDAMELNTELRRKDRTNVLCMVVPDSGDAVVTAVAVEIDNRTGTLTSHTLKPASGLSGSGAAPMLVRIVDPGDGGRRRPVRR